MTNADRIRTMSDQALAEFLESVHLDPCGACCNNFERCRRNNAPEPDCKRHYVDWLEEDVPQAKASIPPPRDDWSDNVKKLYKSTMESLLGEESC